MRRRSSLETGAPASRRDPQSAAGGANVLPWNEPRVRTILGPATGAHAVAGRGLIFAMDATASRQPTWDRAIEVQAAMFSAFAPGLKVQLVYFRGSEFFASRWSRRPQELAALMRGVMCMGGLTQIGHVLSHCDRAAAFGEAATLVYVGDSMEEEAHELRALAQKLAKRRVAAFMFQEGSDKVAETTFRDISAITKGAYGVLGDGAASDLKDLLNAAAAYATGGRDNLVRLAAHRPAARLLLSQMM